MGTGVQESWLIFKHDSLKAKDQQKVGQSGAGDLHE